MNIRLSPFRSSLIFFGIAAMQLIAFGAQQAQENPAASPAGTSVTQPSVSSPSAATSATEGLTVPTGKLESVQAVPEAPTNYPAIQYLKTRAGELVPVLKGVELEGYLKYLETLRIPETARVDSWSIGRLSLEGEASAEFAELTAKFEIQILENEKTVFIPLRLNEATLRDEEHTGAGQCGLWKWDPEQGQVWWFRGAGKYQLNLSLLIPIRTKDPPNRRLQLALPASTVSDMKLRVPSPRVRTLSDEQSARVRVSSNEGISTIELFGLGTRLDFSWQSISNASVVNPTFHSRTAMNVMIDGQSVLIEANQRIEALQGDYSEVVVKLPAGMELIKLEGTRYKEHRIESQDQSQVRVLLDDRNVSSHVDLKWLLRGSVSIDKPQIHLGGFEVEKGRIQSGIVVVRVSGAYRVQRQESQDRNVVRESLAGLDRITSPPVPGAGDPSNIVGVYRILEQPFQLTLDLKKIDPYVSAEQPLYVAHLSGNLLELETTFQVQVARGAIENFSLDWADWKGAGWTIDSCRVRRLTDRGETDDSGEYEVTIDSSDKDSLEIQSAEPIAGHIQVRLKARRPITVGVQGTQILFPELRNSPSENGILVTTLADNLDFDSKPAGTTTIRPLDPPSINSELLSEHQERRRIAYLLNNFDSGLSVRTTVKPPSLTVESMSTISSSERGLNIEQELSYSISYQRFSQLMIWVPTSWLPNCEYRLSTGETLQPVLTQSSEPGYQQVRLALDKSKSGVFQLRIRALVGSNELIRNNELTIPLVRPAEDRLSRSRLQTRNLGGVDLSVVDPRWTREPGTGTLPLWASPTVASDVRCEVKLFSETSSTGTTISRAWIQTTVDAVGQQYHVARLQISGARGKLRFELPLQSELMNTRVRGQEARAVRISEEENAYEITLPTLLDSTTESAMLFECEYSVSASQANSLFRRTQFQPPDLGSAAWREVVWELILPPDEYLLQSPAGLNPLYRWQRKGLLWSRVNSSDAESLAEWVGVDPDKNPSLDPVGWNKYTMSRFGGIPAVESTTIRRHLILAIGAGSALAATVLLLNWPVMRHVLVAWGVGTLLAVLSIWYSEPLILFLQPAIIGFVLGLISSIVQMLRRRGLSRRFAVTPPASGPASNLQKSAASKASPASSLQPSTSLRGGTPVGHSGLSP